MDLLGLVDAQPSLRTADHEVRTVTRVVQEHQMPLPGCHLVLALDGACDPRTTRERRRRQLAAGLAYQQLTPCRAAANHPLDRYRVDYHRHIELRRARPARADP